ncbi:uncharacterized protein PAC_14266 [Phialocephala subalpina]|uniref:Uncharacterized protein n=1 Tax=Phialocephala subalpina TaxID=576137 RepID=A0A1L7XH77_9HELO|nr:uncharacterized protein PAC_14266 [Phialocephala subalpina]
MSFGAMEQSRLSLNDIHFGVDIALLIATIPLIYFLLHQIIDSIPSVLKTLKFFKKPELLIAMSKRQDKVQELEKRVDVMGMALRAVEGERDMYKTRSGVTATVLKYVARRKNVQKEKEQPEHAGSFPPEIEQPQEARPIQEHRKDTHSARCNEKTDPNSDNQEYPWFPWRDQQEMAKVVTFVRVGKPRIVDTKMPSNDAMDGVVESHESHDIPATQEQRNPGEPREPQEAPEAQAQQPPTPQNVPEREGNQVSQEYEELETPEAKTRRAHRGKRGGRRHKRGKRADEGGKSDQIGDKQEREDTEQSEDSDEGEWEVVDALAKDMKNL